MEEQERLKVMLEHWIRHNESHFEEYRRWAETAAQIGLHGVKERIERALEHIERANHIFAEALADLSSGAG